MSRGGWGTAWLDPASQADSSAGVLSQTVGQSMDALVIDVESQVAKCPKSCVSGVC